MKRKLSYTWRVMVALMLAISLGLIFATPVSADATLAVTITSPAGGSNVTVGDSFNLVFDIANGGAVDAANGVTVSIDPGDHAEVDGNGEGVPIVMYIGNIAAGASVDDITVAMHCTSAGTTTITVTPAGTDAGSGDPIAPGDLTADDVDVNQVGPASLVIEVDGTFADAGCTIPQSTFSFCTNFYVKATVTNDSGTPGETADGVEVTLTVDDVLVELAGGEVAAHNLGDITADASVSTVWEVHCLGAGGPSTIEAEITAGTGHDSASDLTGGTDSVDVNQENVPVLEITLDPADDSDVYVGQDFTVTLTVTNSAADPAAVAEDVTPDLVVGGNATYVDGPTPADADIAGGGGSQDFVYTYHCDGVGDVTLTANASGTDENSGATIDALEVVHTVHQVLPAIDVVITTPIDDDDVVWVNQNFQAFATISNSSGGTLTNVTGTLEAGANYAWVSGANPQSVGDLDDGESATVSWWVQCTDAGATTIEVTADCDEGATDIDTATISQIAPTHPELTVDITGDTPSTTYVSQSYSVHASVTNSGEETAMNVTATLGIDTGASLVSGESATKTLGNIPAGETYMVEWTVHCDAVGDTVFTVTADGEDDITGDPITGSDTATVTQVPRESLEVTITSPEPLEKFGPACDSDLYVEFTVENTGYSTLEDVVAMIGFTGNTSWVSGGTADPGHPISLGDIDPGDTVTITEPTAWLMSCTGEDDPPDYTTYTVTATGTSDVCDVEVTDSDEVSIYQKYLHVNIYQPAQEEWCVGSDIIVNATATNCYTGTLNNVRAILTIDGPASLVSGWPAEIDMASIASGATGDTDPAGWHIECTGAGAVTLNVYISGVSGTTTIANEDEITFDQVAGADLSVTIDDPETCQWYAIGDSFTVTGTVANTGDAIASSVEATLVFIITGEAVGTGDGIETDFTLDYPPVYPDSETIYLDGVATTAYTLTDATGEITFTAAPGDGVAITADYKTEGPIDTAHIEVPNPVDVGTLTPGDSEPASWTVTTDGFPDPTDPCDIALSIEVEGDSVCNGLSASSNTVTVHQLPMTVEVTATPDSVVTGETFSIDATITNIGCYTCPDTGCPCEITDVEATISFLIEGEAVGTGDGAETDFTLDYPPVYPDSETIYLNGVATTAYTLNDATGELSFTDPPGIGVVITADYRTTGPGPNASLVNGEQATKFVGDIPEDVDEGLSAQWTVRCDRPGTVSIVVSAVSTDAQAGYYDVTVTSAAVTVTQSAADISYSVPLAKDWNFMSIPIFPLNSAIADVLYDISGFYAEVWSYVGQEWQLYVPGAPDSYYTLLGITKITNMQPGIGYVIRMINPRTVTGQGYELMPGAEPPPTYALLAGWNLSGFKTMDFNDDNAITQAADTMRVGYYLANTDANYDTNIIGQEVRFLRYYEPGAGWQELTQNSSMWIGKGYWLWASQSGLVIVPPVVEE